MAGEVKGIGYRSMRPRASAADRLQMGLSVGEDRWIKDNPNHDPQTGEFSSVGGVGGGGGHDGDAGRGDGNKKPNSLDQDSFVKFVNGDDDAYETARHWMSEGYKEIRKTQQDIHAGKSVDRASKNNVESFNMLCEKAPSYAGEIFRGLKNVESDKLAELTTPGTEITSIASDSWSKSFDAAKPFSGMSDWTGFGNKTTSSVMLRMEKCSSSADLSGLQSNLSYEQEIVVPPKTTYRVSRVEKLPETEDITHDRYIIHLKEA